MILKSLLGIYPEPQLVIYRSFANKDSVHIIGRVIERIKKSTSSSILSNAGALIRTYLASPYKDTEVKIISDIEVTNIKTNQNGIFEITLPFREKIEVVLNDQKVRVEIAASDAEASFGIISDIDDTILISNATRTLRLLYLLFTKNAHSRKPFPGVTKFYEALVHKTNPIFYVSSSVWNIYDLLVEFLDINHIPKGPLLLKEIGGIRSVFKTAHKHGHKQEKIELILDLYPDLQFILIGDSGQQDAEIYSTIAVRHPERIKVIYIRDVTVQEDTIVQKAIKTLEGKVEVILVKTSEEAAAHALEKGYIVKEEVKKVEQAVAQEV
jgi:phosphatidate phosphatase APP1